MFESLSEKFNKIFRDLRGYGRLSESNIKDALREIKLALLEADVNFQVVKHFISSVKEKAIGTEVLQSITPGQQIIKIVSDEIIALLGGHPQPIALQNGKNAVMLIGLQGAGKTTSAAKLAVYFRKKEKKAPLLVALDIQRPAAIEQLVYLGKQVDIPVYMEKNEKDVAKIARNAFSYGERISADFYIFDTAGRLHIDDQLMNELVRVKQCVNPDEILLAVDAMTGQDAVNSVAAFHELLDISGVVLTKMDGDARGGAALSIVQTTGRPIRYVGIGEKIADFDVFYPDRMASRILGMGDVVSLVEKAQEQFDEKQALAIEKKLRKNELDLADFLQQLQQFRKLGPLESILQMMPGAQNMKGLSVDEKQLIHIEAIIQSMTKKERSCPDIIDSNRKKRIALGSGTSVQEVNQLLKKFFMMKKMMKSVMKNKHKFSMMGGKSWR